ncbi:hypothetical protein GCM10010124_19770 [Pilimelia terevasa]|uniref:DUF3099 domain-containing protein n=1 Tax=Pilimelia terevasa TaxID=53372 RepID=A0A8J3BQ65_9ACTN|nr:DUF3099 domain-containing protein [Pilimelia terevasa]GGK27192.1 hypothetical protein GCM10010124_19770 [Pilimelia terevasa]
MAREAPQLITDAQPSADAQLRSRQRRYLTMMSVRVACLILGAVLASAEVPLLWLWLTICAVAMVLLPWLAVLIANDRPAKPQHRLRAPAPAPGAPARTLDSRRAATVIDADD